MTKAVDVEVIALNPVIALTGPCAFCRSAGGPRASWMFPLRMLRVRALADSSGYMVSRIFTEFSWGPATAVCADAQGGRRPGTGSACFGVAAQNCRGDDNVLSPAGAAEGDGDVHSGEARPGSSGAGDVTGGAATSHSGDSWPTGEVGEEGLELEMSGETGCELRGGVATRGASRGGRGGPTSCRILLSASAAPSVGVDVSALARTVCVCCLGGLATPRSPDGGGETSPGLASALLDAAFAGLLA